MDKFKVISLSLSILFLSGVIGCSAFRGKSGSADNSSLKALFRPIVQSDPVALSDRIGINHIAMYHNIPNLGPSARDAGMGWVRIAVSWRETEPRKGQYAFTLPDLSINDAHAAGVKIMLTIGPFMPNFAMGKPDDHVCDEWGGECAYYHPNDAVFQNHWKDYVTTIVNRYKDRVDAFGLWNEPDIKPFLADHDANRFVNNILNPASQIIRSLAPARQVVGPDIVFGNAMLNGVLSQACDSVDVVTLHLYSGMEVSQRLEELDRFIGTVNTHCGANKPIWMTEAGFKSKDLGDEGQAQRTIELIEGVFDRPQVKKYFIFTMFEFEGEDGFGLRTWNWSGAQTSKPAYHLLADYIKSTLPQICVPNASTLCLQDGRFRVTVNWIDHFGREGVATTTEARSHESGGFWFFDPPNIELAVKVIDGRTVNGKWWVYFGQLTDVAFELKIEDLEAETTKVYRNLLGQVRGLADTSAFAVPPTDNRIGTCAANTTRLCFANKRFEATVDWQVPWAEGVGHSIALNPVTQAFWFFASSNVELLLKVLDGRGLNGHFWLFAGALTDVEYTLKVRDTLTGSVREYFNPAGEIKGFSDTNAF